jgi:hypothetical protein
VASRRRGAFARIDPSILIAIARDEGAPPKFVAADVSLAACNAWRGKISSLLVAPMDSVKLRASDTAIVTPQAARLGRAGCAVLTWQTAIAGSLMAVLAAAFVISRSHA